MHNRLFHSLTQFPHTFFCAALFFTFTTASGIAFAQSNDKETAVGFSLVRSFSLPGLPEDDLQSQLFRKTQGDAVIADIVDLNLEFSAEHGKPTTLPPQFAPKTHTIILKFPDGWWTTNMVSADGKGAFICRVKMRMFEPKPAPDDFAKYVDWCHGILTVGALDPRLLGNPSHP